MRAEQWTPSCSSWLLGNTVSTRVVFAYAEQCPQLAGCAPANDRVGRRQLVSLDATLLLIHIVLPASDER